jgi:tetratricopeptide (TPR) repeat protein
LRRERPAAGIAGRERASCGLVRIGRFQVIEPLAGHGDRRVLAAYDPRLDRKVAIELGAPRDGDERARARRRRQARAMAKIGHANVVRVHEVGEHEGELFVATDFVRGATLEGWCSEHPPGSRERFEALLELLMQAARGLAAAHAAEVVRLPLGPGDMLVDGDGRLRLRGWTMADAAGDEREPVDGVPTGPSSEGGPTEGGSSEGPPSDDEARDDQRALCRTFWEAALGSAAPEDGASEGPVRAEVPAWFVAVMRRGLARERRERWLSVDALRAALERGRSGGRRRWALLGASAAVGTVLVLVLVRPSARDECRAPDDAPSRSWAARHEPLEQRFASSGIDRPRSHAVHTSRRLGQFATQWDAERLAACSAADEDEPLAEARLACLDRAATGFHVVLDEIEALEPKRLGLASTFTLSLPELGECREPSASTPDVADDASVREASHRLAEAAMLVNLRRPAKAEQLVAVLEAEGWAGSPGVESRGWLVLANAAYARQDFARARERGRSSLRAAEHDVDPGDAAAAWAVVGNAELALSRIDEAAFAAERVESLATSVDEVLLVADAHTLRGGIENSRGRADLAVASFELAERSLRAELGDRHKRLASLYQDMAGALIQAGRPAQAIEKSRASVALTEDLVGAESPLSMRAHGALGLILAELGQREEAIVELGHAAAGFATIPDPPANDRFLFDIKRAEALGILGRTGEALAVLEQVELPPGDTQAPIAHAAIHGTILLEGGRPAESIPIYEGLLARLEGNGSHHARMNRAITHVNLALALSQTGRGEEAVALAEPTIAEYEALGMPPERMGGVWLELARVYRAAGRLDDARRAAERGMAALERGGAGPDALAKARTELTTIETAVREQEAVP